MTEQNKQLLLKDLCERLPYGVIIYTAQGDFKMIGVTVDRVFTDCDKEGKHNDFPIEVCKPYLRPMSSMTEEELKQLAVLKFQDDEIWEISDVLAINNDFVNVKCKHKYLQEAKCTFQIRISKREMLKSLHWQGIDWLNEHHFDFRGLIPMGLALEAPENMYKMS